MTIQIKVPSGSSPLQRVVNARVSYRNTPIHVLEKFAFKDLDSVNRAFLNAGFDESVVVQTCNRVEVFVASENPEAARVLQVWSELAGLDEKERSKIQTSRGKDVIGHLMRMAAGLDSLVIGEDQILGQIKRAFMLSLEAGHSGPILGAVFDRALKVGTRIRTTTGINRGNVSIASVAMSLAQEYFEDISSRKVLLVGTGQASTLVAKILARQSIPFYVTSRTPERAKMFAETLSGIPVSFEDAIDRLAEVDIVFVASTAPYLLLTHERVQRVLERRSGARLVIFDLSNPRAVDETVSSINGVKLVNLDQIGEVANKNFRSRMKEFHAAERMIVEELHSVDIAINRMKAEPFVNSVFRQAEQIRRTELARAVAILGRDRVSEQDLKVLEQLSQAIVEGILSPPMNLLRREASATAGGDEIIKLASRLFNYDHVPDS